jgi:hypothetical protein
MKAIRALWEAVRPAWSMRGLAWLVTLAFVGALFVAAAVLISRAWKAFPPSDALGAWTAVAGVGALLTGIGTIAVAAFALRGLRSLTIARDEIVHRAQREAKLCAIQRLEEVAAEIVPLNTAALDGLVANKIAPFLAKGQVVQLDPDLKDVAAARSWVAKVPVDVYNKIVTILNRLEAWSVYFAKGVADDEIAFGPIAPLLRGWVGQYYAVLLVVRADPGRSGNYPNLVKLYGAWTARMDADQLARQHADVVAQFEQAKGRLAQQKLPPSTPKIGA